MFGLMYLAWLALTLGLLVFIVRYVVLAIREPDARTWVVGRLLAFIAAFALVTWPFLLGRAVHDMQCRYLAGLQVEKTVDLRHGGYVIVAYPLERDLPMQLHSPFYGHQATQDLLMGRIAFFERELCCEKKYSYGAGPDVTYFHRFSLGKIGHAECIDPEQAEFWLRGLRVPEGQCLARSKSRHSEARYRLEGAHRGKSIELVDKRTNDTVAQFRSFSHWSGFTADAGDLTYHCPSKVEYFGNRPLLALSAFVLPARDATVVSVKDLSDWYRELAHPGAYEIFQELPPREITRQSARPAMDNACGLRAPIPPPYHLQVIRQVSGPAGRPYGADLGHIGEIADQVDIVVNRPELPVVLLVLATRPTIWSVHRDIDSYIAAVIVDGEGGQAVLGVDKRAAIRTPFKKYNTACMPFEWAVLQANLLNYAFSTEDVALPVGENTFIVGSPVEDTASLFYSDDYNLSQFRRPGSQAPLQ